MTEIENYLNFFRNWIREQQPILNSIDTDEFLLRFLRVTNFDLNKAKEWLIHFWKYRTENPQWFTNRDLLKNPLMVDIAETAYCVQLPKETKDQQLIFLMRVGHFDTTKYSLDDVTKYAFAVTDILNTQSAAQLYGFIIILDFSNIKLQHLRQFTPDHTRRYVDCWEKMYPVHLRQIHFYNYPSLFDPVLHLFRMFFAKDLKDKIHLHSRPANESLHQYIDPALLPSEYGGQLGSIEGEMNKTFLQWTREHNDYMIQMDQYGVDLKQVSKLLKTVK
jgi:hypothetical protein